MTNLNIIVYYMVFIKTPFPLPGFTMKNRDVGRFREKTPEAMIYVSHEVSIAVISYRLSLEDELE